MKFHSMEALLSGSCLHLARCLNHGAIRFEKYTSASFHAVSIGANKHLHLCLFAKPQLLPRLDRVDLALFQIALKSQGLPKQQRHIN